MCTHCAGDKNTQRTRLGVLFILYLHLYSKYFLILFAFVKQLFYNLNHARLKQELTFCNFSSYVQIFSNCWQQKRSFPSTVLSGQDMINVRDQEQYMVCPIPWYSVLIPDNKVLSLYWEPQGQDDCWRFQIHIPAAVVFSSWLAFVHLTLTLCSCQVWARLGNVKTGNKNSPGFFLLDSASSVRGLSQVFVSLVTTSHKFFSPLLINKLYSSQSIVKTCSNSGIFQADVDNVGSDFDLNSLIEGDVDDDDFVSSRDNEGASTPVAQTYYAPLKVRNLLSMKYSPF